MKSILNYLKKLLKKYRSNNAFYFDSIDTLPVYYFSEIIETNNYNLLVYKKGVKYSYDFLKNVWNDIYNQFIKEFGISESLTEILEKQRDIVTLMADYQLTKDKSLITHISIAKEELNAMLNNNKSDIYEVKIMLEKWLGFHINLKEVTVKEFYNYLKMIKKQ